MEVNPKGARKWDQGKSRVDLIPSGPLLDLGLVCAHGAMRHDDNNWRLGMNWSRLLAALHRHYLKYNAGQTIDPETGISHMIAVAWNALVLAEYEHTHPERDDRYREPHVFEPDPAVKMQNAAGNWVVSGLEAADSITQPNVIQVKYGKLRNGDC